MKKILTLCLISIMAFALAFTVGCSGGGKLTLNKNQHTLYVGETFVLEVQEEVEVTYTSDNEAVIYVTAGGVISALKAGSATVTARSGNVTATCEFTVLDNVQFTLNKSQVSMAPGDELNLSALVNRTVNGSSSTAGTLSATSSNAAVASIDGGAIQLLANGNTIITITWNYEGKNYTADLAVTVENKVEIEIEQPQQQIFAYGQNTTMQLTTSLVVNRSEVSDPVFAWESSNDAVATVSESGLVTGVTAGTATITAKYTLEGKDYTATTEVSVERAVVEGDKTYKFGYKNQNAVLPADDFIGKIVKVEYNSAVLDITTNSLTNNVEVLGSNFTAEGQVTVDIFTDKTQTTATFDMVTAILMNKEDLDKMDEWGRPETYIEGSLGTQGYLYQYSGTFLLGADIDYGGASYSSDCYVGTNGYVSGAGAYWNGLSFDGQGYKIDNIKFSNSFASLFGQWLSNSTVKNLVMTNVVIEGASATTVQAAAICSVLKGNSVLENIYVSGDVQNNGAALSDISFITVTKEDAATIKNVVVDFKNTSAIGKITGIVNVGSTDSVEKIVNVENCYTIGSIKNICYTVANGTVIAGVTYTWGTWMNVTGSTGGYADAAAFLADYNANNAMLNANVFKVTTEEGATVLQFYNSALGQFRTVLTLAQA